MILASFGVGVVLLGAFIWWELHSDHPMLDVRFFKNPRFTRREHRHHADVLRDVRRRSFLLTQYLQFVLGYTPLEAGVRLLPFAAR